MEFKVGDKVICILDHVNFVNTVKVFRDSIGEVINIENDRVFVKWPEEEISYRSDLVSEYIIKQEIKNRLINPIGLSEKELLDIFKNITKESEMEAFVNKVGNKVRSNCDHSIDNYFIVQNTVGEIVSVFENGVRIKWKNIHVLCSYPFNEKEYEPILKKEILEEEKLKSIEPGLEIICKLPHNQGKTIVEKGVIGKVKEVVANGVIIIWDFKGHTVSVFYTIWDMENFTEIYQRPLRDKINEWIKDANDKLENPTVINDLEMQGHYAGYIEALVKVLEELKKGWNK